MTAYAGSENPDALAEQMTAAEDNKYRLFRFVNELNAELEAFDSQISLLQQELRASSESTDAKQKKTTLIQQARIFSSVQTWQKRFFCSAIAISAPGKLSYSLANPMSLMMKPSKTFPSLTL